MEEKKIKVKLCTVCNKDETQVNFQQYCKICNGCKSMKYREKNPDYFRKYMKIYMKDKYVPIPIEEQKKKGRKSKLNIIVNL